MEVKKNDPFTHSNSILNTKEYNFDDSYNPFFTNKALSQHVDCIMHVAVLNMYPQLPKRIQYDYYFHAIRKLKRSYGKWGKLKEDDEIDTIMAYHGYSYTKAKQVAGILTKSQLSYLKKKMDVGG
jgi:hypothetical protein